VFFQECFLLLLKPLLIKADVFLPSQMWDSGQSNTCVSLFLVLEALVVPQLTFLLLIKDSQHIMVACIGCEKIFPCTKATRCSKCLAQVSGLGAPEIEALC
jgi:hypothetical protein